MNPLHLYKECFKLFVGQEITREGKHFKRLMLSKLEIKQYVKICSAPALKYQQEADQAQ
jgi:hypothetical protein